MKIKHILLTSLIIVLFQLVYTAVAIAYSLILPDVACTPPLPYIAEADHYSGPACVQMTLNACPDPMARHYNTQDSIYSSILSHNAEPTTWFSDPSGIEGALEDPIFLPCGNWVDYSNTDKNWVLSKMLYWMKSTRYLTPVLISSSEHWVTIIGYHTDVEPPYSGPVTLYDILFYDPLPGNPSSGWVTGTVWLNDPAYWGVPLNKPGSAWHNKYIAIIEPPGAIPKVIIPKWILEGRILPVKKIKRYFNRWLKEIRKRELAQGPFKVLYKDIRIERPILIKTAKYSYYLIPFKDHHLAAIFNAYNGSFEELRYFQRPQRYIISPEMINNRLIEALRAYQAGIIRISAPKLRYDPKLALVGRFSPTWKVQAVVRDARGKKHKLLIYLNIGGEIISGLERLRAKGLNTCCAHLEGLSLGIRYQVGDAFTDPCAKVTVQSFQWGNKKWTKDGFTEVGNVRRAGGSGQEMAINNVNLAFDFSGACKGFSLHFGEYGGNLNIGINGDFRNFENFADINHAVIGGVNVSVINGLGNDKGTLKLSGAIYKSKFILEEEEVWASVIIGGQELWIDDICCLR